MIHDTGEMHVEDQRHPADLAEAARGKADAVGLDEPGRGSVVRVRGHVSSLEKGFGVHRVGCALHTDVALARRLAAVDGDDLARHERRLVGGEKDDRTGHFVGLADTA